MAKALYLVRHAAVAVPVGVCYGRSDVKLLAPVALHARWLRARLPADVPVFSSPLSRCALLAEAIVERSTAPIFDKRLSEMDFGEWEMQPFDDMSRALIDAWAGDPMGFRVPGGETGSEVVARVAEVLAGILERHDRAIIVAHGGPLRGICSKLLALPRGVWPSQDIALGSLTILRADSGEWRAEYFVP